MEQWLNHLFPFFKGQFPKELKINQAQSKYIHFSAICFVFLQPLNRQTEQNTEKKMSQHWQTDGILLSASVMRSLTCSGAMYDGVPLYSVLSTRSLASSASAVTRPKSPIFTTLFRPNMMFSGCSRQKWSNISLRTGATSHRVLMVSTSPSDPCGWTFCSGCIQLHWLFVWKSKDFPLSSPGFDFHFFDLSILWGF